MTHNKRNQQYNQFLRLLLEELQIRIDNNTATQEWLKEVSAKLKDYKRLGWYV
jgi:hypothetical protein